MVCRGTSAVLSTIAVVVHGLFHGVEHMMVHSKPATASLRVCVSVLGDRLDATWSASRPFCTASISTRSIFIISEELSLQLAGAEQATETAVEGTGWHHTPHATSGAATVDSQ